MNVAWLILSFFLVARDAAGLRSLAQATPSGSRSAATLTAAAANAMRNVDSLQAALSSISGVAGRPVSYKNIEAARYIAYASGSMMVPAGMRICELLQYVYRTALY
jgi:1-deoxy-D-xylulose 5-phosphate reductoisomerase